MASSQWSRQMGRARRAANRRSYEASERHRADRESAERLQAQRHAFQSEQLAAQQRLEEERATRDWLQRDPEGRALRALQVEHERRMRILEAAEVAFEREWKEWLVGSTEVADLKARHAKAEAALRDDRIVRGARVPGITQGEWVSIGVVGGLLSLLLLIIGVRQMVTGSISGFFTILLMPAVTAAILVYGRRHQAKVLPALLEKRKEDEKRVLWDLGVFLTISVERAQAVQRRAKDVEVTLVSLWESLGVKEPKALTPELAAFLEDQPTVVTLEAPRFLAPSTMEEYKERTELFARIIAERSGAYRMSEASQWSVGVNRRIDFTVPALEQVLLRTRHALTSGKQTY